MFAQSTGSMREPGRVGVAFLTALALHTGALLAVTHWRPQDTMSPPGEQQITIDLAPAMETVDSVAPAEVSAPEVPRVEAEALPIEDTPLEMTEVAQAEAEPVAESLAPDAVPPLDPSDAVIAQPVEAAPTPKPVKSPPKEVARKLPPKPRRVTAERSPPPANPRQGQASSSRENMQGAAASADPTVLNRYKARLAAALRNRLRYPHAARSQGISGVATIQVFMDRSGRIASAAIVRSAGHPMLDDAALAAARPGSSLPAAPDSLPQQQFTLAVPLRFDIR